MRTLGKGLFYFACGMFLVVSFVLATENICWISKETTKTAIITIMDK